MKDGFLHKLFSFRFISVCGIIIAACVFYLQTDAQPLSSFVFNPSLYTVASLVAIGWHVFLWLVVEKATFYEFFRVVKDTFEDCIIINIVLLCTLSFLFLITSFL